VADPPKWPIVICFRKELAESRYRDLAAGKRVVSIPYVLLNWAILSLAFWLTSKVVPGFRIAGLWDAVLVAAIFGIVNWLLGTLLFGVFVIFTLGIGLLLSFITHWLVNAVLLKITDALTSRLQVQSFGSAMVAALVMSLLGKVGIYVAEHAMHTTHPGSIYL
jgi:putative membrane protein